MRAPASDNTLRVHELRERYRLAGKKSTTPPAPASPQRPSRARASLWRAADKARLPLTLRARAQPCSVAIPCCCRDSDSDETPRTPRAWSARPRRLKPGLKWAEKAYAKLEPHRVQGGHFPPLRAKRSIALAVSIVVLLRSLGGTRCTLVPVVGNAGIRVFPADAPTLGLSHAQLGAALVNLDGAYANVYGRAASRKITSYMDCGFYWRSKRIYFDLGGGGSSRNGYNGAQVWPILKQLGKTDPQAQELVDFHERLGAHLSERLKFEVSATEHAAALRL